MCGIVGFNWFDKVLIRRMSDKLIHRGPDGFGYYTDKNVSLGHRRLAIIDLSIKGKQPMSDDSETIWITFNGEIYNYRELRRELEKKYNFKSETDTETIIYAYKEYGVECLKKLNGDFAFCLYDINKNIFLLARDHIGVKPLFYYYDNNKFIFASEIKSILEDNTINRIINNDALSQYLAYRFVFTSNTIFNNIFRMLPGEYLIFDLKTKKLKKNNYYNINFSNKFYNDSFYLKKYKKFYTESVSSRLMSDVSLGVYLSGGIDSSSVVAMMNKLKVNDIKTFSVGFDHKKINELPYAKKVSDFFNTDHKEFVVKSDIINDLNNIIYHADEPLCDPAMIPVYLLSKNAKKYVSVVLTGDGGDETLAGYEQVKFLHYGNKIKKIPLAINFSKSAIKLVPNAILNKFFKYSSSLGNEGKNRAVKFLDSIHDLPKAYTEITSIFDYDEQKNYLNNKKIIPPESYINNYFIANNNINKILNFETKVLLPENMLTKSDRMTMAFGVESRVPLLDYKLVNLAFSMPNHLKLNGFKNKYILRKIVSDLLPKDIINRKKQRFYVPIDLWLKSDLMSLIEDKLSIKNINKQGIFDYYIINKMIKNFNSSPLFYARQLWSLLTFELWYEKFIEK